MADPISLFDHVAESPDVANQFMEALGPNNSHLAKGAIMGKLMEAANNPATGTFSPDAMINQLKSPGYREIFTAAERSGAENLLRQLRTARPEDLASRGAGMTAGKMFHLALPLGAIAAGVLSGHAIGGAIVGSGIEIGMHTFATKILLNPKYARIAAQLPYQQATSSQAGLLAKGLMQALKGSGVTIILPNGERKPARVDEDGKVQPN